ncbi:MAG: AMP-binding protein, partial [Firmicutes bacterium]|nr:AMP-binding protein [Bacillota bacterium]
VCGERRVTWGEFNERINKVANALIARGLQKGDKVSVLMNNSIEMFEIIFGTVKSGGVIVPLSAMVPGESLVMMIKDSESRYIFVDQGTKDLIAPCLDQLGHILPDNRFITGPPANGWVPYEKLLSTAPGDDPAVSLSMADDFNIIYSSGTTGTPKGIVHTHYARGQFALGLALEFRLSPESRTILTTPLYTNGTWMIALPSILVGATLVVMPYFDPEVFLQLVQEEQCTHTFMIPLQFVVTMVMPEFDHYDLSSMKVLVSAGAPLRKDTKADILRKFGCSLVELYGITEGVASTLKPADVKSKIASVGTPLLATDLRIIDEQGAELPWGESGEIVGYSAGIMREYHNNPQATAEAIWRDERGRTFIKTGDIGKYDPEGFLYILERKKDMIISGGVNIFSIDLENIIIGHPAVQDVAIIGVPHEKWGETPVALVVLKGDAGITAGELKEWANSRLARYQRLSVVEFRKELPRNVLGKVLKRQLRESYLSGNSSS